MTIAAAPLATGPIAALPDAGGGESAIGTAVLPLRVIVGEVGAAVLPLRVAVGDYGQAVLPISVSVVSPGVLSGGDTVTDGGSLAAVWGCLVKVAGVDVSDSVLGEILVEAEENAARVADFVLHRPGEVVVLAEWTGKPVHIYLTDMRTGTPQNAQLLFSGVVDLPRVDFSRQSLVLRCTDNRQAIIAGLSRAQIDALVAGKWSPAVFDKAAGAWVYANDQLSTVAAALDLSPAGELRLTPWAAKPVADLAFGDDDVLEQTVLPDAAERGGLINRVDINFGYRFSRVKAEGYVVSFDAMDYYETSFVFWVRDEGRFLVREAVISAIEAAGGTIESISWIALPTEAQTIPGVGGGAAGVWIPNPATDPDICIGFDAVVSFDYIQRVDEHHKLTVQAPLGIEAMGVLKTEMSGALDAESDPLAIEQGITLYKAGMTRIPPSDVAPVISGTTNAVAATVTPEMDRAAANGAMETLVAVAMTRIFESHRGSSVAFDVACNPVLDVNKTVAVDAQGVNAMGKVRRLTHRLDPSSATAVSSVELAICSVSGVGITHPVDEIVAPEGTTDGSSGVLGAPTVVWNGLLLEDGQITVTFPGVADAQRQTAIEVFESSYSAPLVEDLFTVTL